MEWWPGFVFSGSRCGGIDIADILQVRVQSRLTHSVSRESASHNRSEDDTRHRLREERENLAEREREQSTIVANLMTRDLRLKEERKREKAERERRRKGKELVTEEERSLRKGKEKLVPEEERNKPEEQHAWTELLPEIPDDITLQMISTRLPLSTFHALSSMNSAWQQAVQSRQVFEARVRSGSTETLVVINHSLPDNSLPGKRTGIAVYSMQSKAYYQLPPIPQVRTGIPEACQCVTLDGKIYVLGGLSERTTHRRARNAARKAVYMLDMAGQKQWKECASMKAARHNFGCCVFDGLIYACGGSSYCAPVPGTEVYDSEVDDWTTLSPMLSWRIGHDIGVMKDEPALVVSGGSIFHPHYQELQLQLRSSGTNPTEESYVDRADHVEIYSPMTDEWRTVPNDFEEHLIDRFSKTLFVAESRLHSLSETAIATVAFDLNGRNSETELVHRVTPGGILKLPRGIPLFYPRAIVAVDDVLLSLHTWYESSANNRIVLRGTLVQSSRGFGTNGKEIEWHLTPIPLSFDRLKHPFIRTLQL